MGRFPSKVTAEYEGMTLALELTKDSVYLDKKTRCYVPNNSTLNGLGSLKATATVLVLDQFSINRDRESTTLDYTFPRRMIWIDGKHIVSNLADQLQPNSLVDRDRLPSKRIAQIFDALLQTYRY